MGSLARGIACASTLFVVAACAAIAGVEDPGPGGESSGDPATPGAPEPTGPGATPGAPPPTGSSGEPAPSSDSGADASAPPAPACPAPRKPNGQSCGDPSECCSDTCREDRRCATKCEGEGGGCSFASSTDCCVGLWCGGGTPARTRCVPCILPGQPAERDGPVPAERSCCSRSANFTTKNCN
ncbi:MAG: hypothetical protein KF764_09850 [Labilithrix sp.]|nr:hypothetical protein [Labilithrix sp.]